MARFEYQSGEFQYIKQPNGFKRRKSNSGLKEMVSSAYSSFKYFLRETPAEIFILGGLCMTLAGGISGRHEYLKKRQIPLGFSEITQIEQDSQRQDKNIGEITEYYAKLNDATMKIFENSNVAWKNTLFGNNHHAFAKELEYNMDPSLRTHHYNLSMLLDQLPKLGQNAYQKMADLAALRLRIKTVNQTLDDAWATSHIDHYRTEHYTETEHYTDSDGNSHSRTVHKTRQVYDHTTHTYNYHPENGEAGSRLMTSLTNQYPILKWPEILKLTKQTNAEGEYAAEQSRAEKFKQKMLGQQELLKIANTWNFGSAYNVNQNNIFGTFKKIAPLAQDWQVKKTTAHSVSYNTGSRSDSGPREYQSSEHALENGRSLENSLDGIFIGIEKVASEAPKLKKAINEYIGVVLDGKEGNPGKLKTEIMKTALKHYNKNFPEGFNVDRSNYLNTFFWILGGMIVGGLIGAGLDKLGDNRDWFADQRRY